MVGEGGGCLPSSYMLEMLVHLHRSWLDQSLNAGALTSSYYIRVHQILRRLTPGSHSSGSILGVNDLRGHWHPDLGAWGSLTPRYTLSDSPGFWSKTKIYFQGELVIVRIVSPFMSRKGHQSLWNKHWGPVPPSPLSSPLAFPVPPRLFLSPLPSPLPPPPPLSIPSPPPPRPALILVQHGLLSIVQWSFPVAGY
jgi:hypothetical protein